MQQFHTLFLTLAVLCGLAYSAPLRTNTGSQAAVIVTDQNTLNASAPAVTAHVSAATNSSGMLQLALVNNLGTDGVHAYVSGLDDNGELVMLNTAGTWYYPQGSGNTPQPLSGDVSLPLGGPNSTTTFTLPGYISSARVWFAEGELKFSVVKTDGGQGLVEPAALNLNDPNANTNWGFIELTYTKAGGLFANLSFVDFVGMALGMHLQSKGNATQEAPGVPHMGKYKICDDLKAQAAKDGQPWDQLCVNNNSTGDLMRVLSPAGHLSSNSTSFSDYWTNYTTTVAQHFAASPLTINTQVDNSLLVNCTASTNSSSKAMLTCQGDNHVYATPTASDIFGCNTGPFAIQESDNAIHKAVVPRLCAAFNRGTFLINGGNVQPGVAPTEYYVDADGPKNWYSAIVHRHEIDGRGYAFSYDDVAPNNGDDVAGVVADFVPDNAQVLTVFAGGHLQ